jgi:hypothetical protein
MQYCVKHGLDYRSGDCPQCVADRRHEESLESAVAVVEANIEIAKRAAYLQANPGDYECPHCGYITLLRNKPRCPICHGIVGSDYWASVQERETRARAAQAERDKKEAEERAKQAQTYAANRVSESSWGGMPPALARAFAALGVVFFAYLLPALSLISAAMMMKPMDQVIPIIKQQLIWYVVPVLNWFMCLLVILFADDPGERILLLASLGGWSIVGTVFVYLSKD